MDNIADNAMNQPDAIDLVNKTLTELVEVCPDPKTLGRLVGAVYLMGYNFARDQLLRNRNQLFWYCDEKSINN